MAEVLVTSATRMQALQTESSILERHAQRVLFYRPGDLRSCNVTLGGITPERRDSDAG